MTVRELLNELNSWVATDSEWLDAKVTVSVETEDSVKVTGIHYVAANDDGTISIEGE